MKNKITFILFALLAMGCSKDNAGQEDPALSDGYDNNGIRTNINDQELTFNRYYTKVETFPDYVNFLPVVEVLYNSGDQITVTWKYNNSDVPNVGSEADWNSGKQKWYSYNKPDLGRDHYLYFGDKIKASVRLPDGKTVTIENSVKENKIVRDVLGVNFGMSKTDVIKNECDRMRSVSYQEYQPNTLMMSKSTNIQYGVTIYRFKEDKLIEVGEYTRMSVPYSDPLNKSVINYCKKVGLKEEPTVDENGNLSKNYTWSNQDITFTLSVAYDIPDYNKDRPALGISYKLK